MFISQHYVKKAWPKHERTHAQARALIAKDEYILPARFDDTDVPGLAGTVGYIDLRTLTPEQLVNIILRKLGRDTVAIDEAPPKGDSDKVFDGKWEKLSGTDQTVLAALVDEGGVKVLGSTLRVRLREHYRMEKNSASQAVRERAAALRNAGLIISQETDSGEMFSLHPTWESHVRLALRSKR